MIIGAWNLSGYYLPEDQLIEKFDSANDILFSFSSSICENNHNGSEDSVDLGTFIRCSHCRKNLCFNCFLCSSNEHFHFESDLEPTIIDYVGLEYVQKSKK